MNFYERCHSMTYFSVPDYQNASDKIKEQFRYFDNNTSQEITDWENLKAVDEIRLSIIHQYLQVFGYVEKKRCRRIQES